MLSACSGGGARGRDNVSFTTICFCCMCFVLISCVSLSSSASAAVWTYDVPGGEALASPDYEVTVESKGVTRRAFVHHSRGLRRYTRYKWNMEPAETRTFDGRGMVACSWAIFSMSGKVTVRVKVRRGASEITLPLTSAKVLPSSYGIPRTVENGDTITFTLDWPEKVAVVPNYDEAWRVFVEKGRGHVPARSWRCEYADEKKRESYHGTRLKASLSEGYRNLLVILAHPPEEDVPDRDAAGTLVVRAGDRVTQEALDAHSTVYFTPGVHDLSKMGKLPWWQTLVKKGQTVYLEGGSYLKARFKRNEGPGEGEATIRGRGVISGIAHPFVRSFEEGSQVIGMDNLLGVTIAERACFGIYGGHVIDGVAMLAGWHGNTDGPDYLDDCVIRNCFLMAHDDNLKLNHDVSQGALDVEASVGAARAGGDRVRYRERPSRQELHVPRHPDRVAVSVPGLLLLQHGHEPRVCAELVHADVGGEAHADRRGDLPERYGLQSRDRVPFAPGLGLPGFVRERALREPEDQRDDGNRGKRGRVLRDREGHDRRAFVLQGRQGPQALNRPATRRCLLPGTAPRPPLLVFVAAALRLWAAHRLAAGMNLVRGVRTGAGSTALPPGDHRRRVPSRGPLQAALSAGADLQRELVHSGNPRSSPSWTARPIISPLLRPLYQSSHRSLGFSKTANGL
jgi:hypothetical protein